MDEARRFIRYVIPGMVFVGVFVSLLCLLWGNVSWLNQIAGREAGLGVVLASVLATGGIGIFLSAIYHRWHWRAKATTIDHSHSIRRLCTEEVLKLRDYTDSAVSRKNAWIITTALWHQRLITSEKIKGAEQRVRDLLDLMHSQGTAAFAASAAGVLAFVLAAANSDFAFRVGPILRTMLAAFVAIASSAVFYSGYKRTGYFAQGLIDQVLSDALVEEQSKLPKDNATGPPVVTWPLLKGVDDVGFWRNFISLFRKMMKRRT